MSKALQAKVNQPSFSLIPTTYKEAMEFSQVLANSGVLPKQLDGRPGAVFMVVQMGLDVGLTPTQAIQCIAYINGKLALYGDGPLAVCNTHPAFEDCIEKYDPEQGAAFCTVRRRNREPKTVRYSVEDAKVARLWGKQGPWTTNPLRMLQLRARGFALRDMFPDALLGISIGEEIEDYEILDSKTRKPTTRPVEYVDMGYTEEDKAVFVKEMENMDDRPTVESPSITPPPPKTAPVTPKVSYEDVVAAIEAAETPSALTHAARMARELTGDNKTKAWELGANKLAELKAMESARQAAEAAEKAAREADEESSDGQS